ncbi:FecR domain-containing protein [candidate division WWE3 bacterium]|nr:FecR domain-containing protein [candidate division WWE3 bacterium]
MDQQSNTPPSNPPKINATVPDPAMLDSSYKSPKDDEIVPKPYKSSGSSKDTNKLIMLAASVLMGMLALGGAAYYLFAGQGASLFQSSTTPQIPTLVVIEGEVQVKTAEQADWINAVADQEISKAMLVKTGNASKAIIKFPDKSETRLNQNSVVEFTEIIKTKYHLKQVTGEVYHRVMPDTKRLYTVEMKGLNVFAEGTAYDIQETGATNFVVKAIEGKVTITGANSLEQKFSAGQEAQAVSGESPTATVGKIDPEQFNSPWFQFNKKRDTDQKYTLGVFANTKAPTLTVSTPKDGTKTKSTKIALKGKTDADAIVKIKINDSSTIIPTKKGQFGVSIDLKDGQNKITVQAYTTGGVLTEKVVTLEKLVPTPTPTKKPSGSSSAGTKVFELTNVKSSSEGKIAVTWKMSNYEEPNGFMVIYSKNQNPQFPPRGGDVQTYVNGGNRRSITLEAGPLDLGGTFYVRACRYIADTNQCYEYTQNESVVVAPTEWGAPSISLTGAMSGNRSVDLNWKITGGAALQGYKIVWSTSQNPTYPQNQASSKEMTEQELAQVLGANDLAQSVGLSWGSEGVSSPAAVSKTLTFSSSYAAGRWYIRVCRVRSSECDVYSNQIEVTTTD